MIIVSQDKKSIVNFEQMARLYVDIWSNEEFATEPNCFCIKAEKASDNIYMFLGAYKTEKRAQEVLEEIVQKYSSYLELRGGTAVLKGTSDVQPNIFNIPKIYEMPKE